jgi:dTDP-4-dehydrorhamnose reductase
MRIGITGASGMLGSALVSHLSKNHEIFATSRGNGLQGKNIEWDCFDLTDIVSLNQWLKATNLDVIIHCAAIVNVDECEDNIELAISLHVKTTEIIVNYLDSNNGRLIYISTDSVFNGEKQGAYNESDLASPLNVYSKTKLMGEKPAQSMENGLVLRTNIIGWSSENRVSFVEWMLKSLIDNKPLDLFYDVHFSPLHVDSLSLIIEKIIENPIFGLYHCASRDSVSKYDFGMKMAKVFNLSNLNINRVSVEKMNFKAHRPKNMDLNVQKLALALEYEIPDVIEGIEMIKLQYDKNNN